MKTIKKKNGVRMAVDISRTTNEFFAPLRCQHKSLFLKEIKIINNEDFFELFIKFQFIPPVLKNRTVLLWRAVDNFLRINAIFNCENLNFVKLKDEEMYVMCNKLC